MSLKDIIQFVKHGKLPKIITTHIVADETGRNRAMNTTVFNGEYTDEMQFIVDTCGEGEYDISESGDEHTQPDNTRRFTLRYKKLC